MSEQPLTETAHTPLEVTSVDGMPMVLCSCDADDPRRVRWQSAYWLREHWQGTQDDGVAAIQAVVARQASAEPRCWRSECRSGCYYPDVCSERPVSSPPGQGATDV